MRTFIILIFSICFVLKSNAQTLPQVRLVPEAQNSNSMIQRPGIPICYCVPVGITTQPVSPAPGCIYNSVHQFHVVACGTGPFSYQWKENSMNISDTGVYSGTNTATLTITNPSFDLNGKHYRCVITNCTGNSAITNNNSVLTLTTLDSDINKDGVTNNVDLLILEQHFNTSCSQCPEDINSDGLIDNRDFLRLLCQFYQSCN